MSRALLRSASLAALWRSSHISRKLLLPPFPLYFTSSEKVRTMSVSEVGFSVVPTVGLVKDWRTMGPVPSEG